ncbi:RNA-binding S4 domain-containing protein [Parvibaculaceae bacterium PLY_AMNH_Bact1]|nr:RNA-binding S4 domain-containing protein [Parvibaculaceae bacterium PLY_AMNH_Bact1]
MAAETPHAQTQRLDRWLWFARFFKSRTLAASIVSAGKVRVNTERVGKPSHSVKTGDVLTFPAAKQVRVIKIVDLGTRRGPAPEAQALYEDQAPPEPRKTAERPQKVAEREAGAGRPTKRERRQTTALKKGFD